MSLIAITGLIASGKSTAMNMLKIRRYGDQIGRVEFIDLDQYSKNLRSQEWIKNKQRTFISSHFPELDKNIDVLSPSFIIENIFSDPILYKEYGEIFQQHFVDYLWQLKSQQDTTFIIECSALFSYPRLMDLMDGIINIVPNREIHLRNVRSRNIPQHHFEIFSNIYVQHYRWNTKLYEVQLTIGTLMELRAGVEAGLIYQLAQFSSNESYKQYYTSGYNIISLMNCGFSADEWNDNPYHNENHTKSVITDLILSGYFTETLGYTALFHDYKYVPGESNNEQNAIRELIDWWKLSPRSDEVDLQEMCNIIMYTKYIHKLDKTSATFALSDLSHFLRTPEEIIETEQLLFREYGKYNFEKYKQTHIKILKSLPTLHPDLECLHDGINIACAYINTYTPNIAWFCGSFNPFTIGHLDILEKAQKMFDKVIVVQGFNPNKPIPDNCEYLQETLGVEVICRCESIPNLIDSVGYTPTLIRGIRNYQDVTDATDWINQINEFVNNKANLCMIPGDPQYNHISSSFVRAITNMGKDTSKFVI